MERTNVKGNRCKGFMIKGRGGGCFYVMRAVTEGVMSICCLPSTLFGFCNKKIVIKKFQTISGSLAV